MRRCVLAGLVLLAGCGTGPDVSPDPAATRPLSTLTSDPDRLVLPTGRFRYDPLLTLRDDRGQPVWVDLPHEVRATSSNPGVATVNERVRIRTTEGPGTTEISLATVADPTVQTSVRVTTVQAAFREVRLGGPSHYDLYVGQGAPLNATAVLSTGDVIPHAEYSVDLDVVTGPEFAAVVDGVGLTALRPTSRRAIELGFLRGGGTAAATLTVREMALTHVTVEVGGQTVPYRVPTGYRARVSVTGHYEDGTTRDLEPHLSQADSFAFANGCLTATAAGRTADLELTLPDGSQLTLPVLSVDGSGLPRLHAEFAHYPDDPRVPPGATREVRLLADLPNLPGYRVSGADLGQSTAWPRVRGQNSGPVTLALGGAETSLPLEVVTPRHVTVGPRIPTELGAHATLRTLVDFGDGKPVNRTRDYPAVQFPGQRPSFAGKEDATTFFLDREGPFTFQAEGLSAPPATVQVARQSRPD